MIFDDPYWPGGYELTKAMLEKIYSSQKNFKKEKEKKEDDLENSTDNNQ